MVPIVIPLGYIPPIPDVSTVSPIASVASIGIYVAFIVVSLSRIPLQTILSLVVVIIELTFVDVSIIV